MSANPQKSTATPVPAPEPVAATEATVAQWDEAAYLAADMAHMKAKAAKARKNRVVLPPRRKLTDSS